MRFFLSRSKIDEMASATLISYGAQVSATMDSFRTALQQSKTLLTEACVAEIIVAVLPRDDLAQNTPWNLEVMAEVFNQDCRNLNWEVVARRLDHPYFTARTEPHFRSIMTFYTRSSGVPFPGTSLMGLWANRSAQLVLLLMSANNLYRNSTDYSRLVSKDNLLAEIPAPQNACWICLPFYNTMLQLAGVGFNNEVLACLLEASEIYPEYVTLMLAQAQDPNSNARAEVLRRTLPKFTGLAGSRPSSVPVMKRLLAVNPDLLILLFRMAFKRSVNMSDIVERSALLQSCGEEMCARFEAEGLPDELMGFWCVQADRGLLNLEEKVASVMRQNHGVARSFLTFLKQQVQNLRVRENPEGGIVSFNCFSVIFRALQAVRDPNLVPPDEMRGLAQVFAQMEVAAASQVAMHASQVIAGKSPFLDVHSEPDEIEIDGNNYYQRVYKGEISVGELIANLKRFKTSQEIKEQETFRFMIHSLFDEVRFFHKYPEKELQITSQVFGQLITNHLVSSITLGVALRYVIEALHKDPEKSTANAKLFSFGKMVTETIKTRLNEWPVYCNHLLAVPHLQKAAPALYEDIQKAYNGQPVSSGKNDQVNQKVQEVATATGAAGIAAAALANEGYMMPDLAAVIGSVPGSGMSFSHRSNPPLSQQMATLALLAAEKSGFGNLEAFSAATNPLVTNSLALQQPSGDALESSSQLHPRNSKPSILEEMVKVNVESISYPTPSDPIKDQIHFIVNNIAQNNVESKVVKLRELLTPECYVWFATYLVTKRISQQPNLHPLYLNFLETFDSSQMFKDILDATYYNVTKLLQSPNITTSSSERSLLRNLGIWLGQVTLGRNKPILQRRLNLKELLFWGYETGRLIAVCSFVAKTIEGVRESKVFRPPNPWLMALLGVMRDLYEVEELKMNIKFEVQVLCKNVSIRIEDVPRAHVLGNLRMPNKDKNPDFTVKMGGSTPTSLASLAIPGGSFGGKMDEDFKAGGPMTDSPVIPNLSSYVVVNAGLLFFTQNPGQRRVVVLAVDRAIREIIQPVVDRSAQVACVTTKGVVLKDFALETNESLVRNAAQLMVSQLAGSLAQVTCKEPLRISLASNLRHLLSQMNVTDQQVIDQIVQVCSNDNLELGCALIEKASMEKASRDIDENLQSAYQSRRKCRETGQAFVDQNIQRQAGPKFPRELPEALKARPNNVLPHQLQLYEGFTRQRLQATVSAPSDVTPNMAEKTPPGAVMLNQHQALEALQIILQRIDAALKTIHQQAGGREVTITMLPGDHEIISLLRDMIIVTQRTQASVRVETAITFAEMIYKRMSADVTVIDFLRLEVMIGSLEALRDACGDKKRVLVEVASWLHRYGTININDEPSRKMHRAILLLSLRAKLIRSADVDAYLASNMDSGRSMLWVEMALSFVRQCLADGIAATQEFVQTFDVVSKMRPANSGIRKQLQKWLSDLRVLAASKDEQKQAAAAANPAAVNQSAITGASSRDSSVREHVSVLLDRWLRVCAPNTAVTDQIFANYLHLMHQFGVLKTEEAADRFFRVASELCVEAVLKTATPPATPEGGPPPPANAATVLNFTVIDSVCKLFLLLIRLADKESGDAAARVNLLSRILSSIVRTLLEDHEVKKSRREIFDQRPYYRLFSNLAQELPPVDSPQDPNSPMVALVMSFTQAYQQLNPIIAPAFAYSWLMLISHRHFMPYLFYVKGNKGWPYMHRLIVTLFQFLVPYLKTYNITEPVRKLYKGLLRVLLVVLHDFPEFLVEYHVSFCDAIPFTCVQLRNLILSAFPKSMRLPDPFTPNLKVDMIPEISMAPRIHAEAISALSPIRQRLDQYIQSRQPPELPSLLPQVIGQAGVYNLPVLNALVLYLGVQGVLQTQGNPPVPIESTISYDMLKSVAEQLDSEGRFHLLSSMANHLRFPNAHTRFFSQLMLLLFAEADTEFVQEQITRVLLERLIVHRPHPVRFRLFAFACTCRSHRFLSPTHF